MPVTEYERNQLFVWFEEHMGKERAATMMSLLPPAGWGDVATRRDVEIAVERIDTKFDIVAERLDGRIDGLAEQMATKADLHELRSDLQRTFVTWLFAAQATVVAAVGLLFAVLR